MVWGETGVLRTHKSTAAEYICGCVLCSVAHCCVDWIWRDNISSDLLIRGADLPAVAAPGCPEIHQNGLFLPDRLLKLLLIHVHSCHICQLLSFVWVLFLMLFFNAIFLLMAISINRNVRLQQENQLLSMQQQRYESLKAAIEEARQARHDLRHQLCQLAALAEEGNLEKIKAYLSGAVSRIPSLELHFCENRAADGVVGYYCALAKREQIPFSVQLDLPECLPVDEVELCLVLSNLLENALEASLRTAPARRRIELTAYLHSGSLALIQVENTYDGVIREKGGVFQSSKRKGDGVGLLSVRHIAEKSGGVSTVTYQDGLFCAKVMLCG